MRHILLYLIASTLSVNAWALPNTMTSPSTNTDPNVDTKPVLLAKKSKKKKSSTNPTSEKIISREGRQKSKDSRNIDFDAIDIGGRRKVPMSNMVNQAKSGKGYNFLKIRTDWRNEMRDSAVSLDN